MVIVVTKLYRNKYFSCWDDCIQNVTEKNRAQL